MSKLVIDSGKDAGSICEIEKDVITIGRTKDNDLPLLDKTASRKHCKVERSPEGFFIIDLDSHNGTFVNGRKIKSYNLRNQDEVKVGTTILIFVDETEKTTPPPPPREPENRTQDLSRTTFSIKEEDVGPEVLASIKSGGVKKDEDLLPKVEPVPDKENHLSLIDLEKSNKTLYVLYQISRELNKTTDFDELLRTIMDLIFQVIDADYGFVAVFGDKPDEIIPKVIKYRTVSKDSPQELKISRTIVNKIIKEKSSILTSNAMEDKQFEGAKSIFLQNIRSAMSVPLWRKDDVIGMIQVDSFRLSNIFRKADLDLLTTISNQMAMVIEQANLNEKIRREELARNRLERFHSPEVVDLIAGGDEVDEEALLTPKEQYATILFTDIVSFTPLSERLSPTDISKLLNHYFWKMTDIIFDYNGTLDKYIGDAIMAVFGAPIVRENDAERAVLAALEMRRGLFRIMSEMEPEKKFNVRVGINSGKVVAGNLGSPKRMDYTVLGDTVNTASRIESIAEPNQILIGEETYYNVKDKFNINELGLRSVKGKSEPIRVYEVMD